MKTAFFSI